MNEQIGSGNVGGLLAYLDQVIEKGWAPKGAVLPLKTAIKQVFSIAEGEEWEKTSVRNIDAEDYLNRFSNKTLGSYSSQSLITYKSRVLRAISWYERFLTNPGWTPKAGNRASTSKKPATEKISSSKVVEQVSAVEVSATHDPNDKKMAVPNLITYPFPLQSGELAYLYLPTKLTKAEAQRMSDFLTALALD